jgi:2-polyprenyl-3-methyl-5-hydroxy-6-metoxy-1,4-benzoquinol methylase
MKRAFDPEKPEFMDLPQPVTTELEAEMRNLASINRHLGSHRLMRKFLELWLHPGRSYRVLDLCTGGGDLPRAMVDWARARDITLRIDAVDASEASLEIARAASGDYPEIRYVRSDVLKFETRETYDLVSCTLALHHFSEEQAVEVLRRCRDYSHRFVLVSDLERSLLTLAGVYLLTTLFYPEPVTRDDGVISAQRAFSFREFCALAVAARWQDFGHARFLVCRQALWLDMRDLADIPIVDTGVVEGLPCPT